ncbi:hypothetical protein [Vulcanisaeta thermophila]|uniref:hypothetical protein n=1 Tax=Vulcanisaeta thermophila TaxID=867917 RepID=UPI000853C6F4|nr:hypothetical protein [Vulcanisaeta thermophila]
MKLNYVIIKFLSPFHVGVTGLVDTYDYVPSDTVYGALEWLSFMGVRHGVERVSSAMPMVTWGGKPSLPVPMPAKYVVELARSIREPRALKVLRGVRFIPRECLESGIMVRSGPGGYGVYCGDGVVGGSYGNYVDVVKNTMSRFMENSDIYRVVAFQPRVDYVIYYQGDDKGVFDLLGRIGFGGERSLGLGKFTVVSRGSIEVADEGKYALLMGVARVRGEPKGFLNWEVRAWNCSTALIGPVSVLVDGSVIEGKPIFENIDTGSCRKRLDPVVLWLS